MKTLHRFAAALMLCAAFVLSAPLANAAAGPWVIHDGFKSRILNGGGVNLTTDTIKVSLHTSASNAATTSVNNYASLTSEHSATSTGYTTGGATASSPGISGTSTVTFDTADVTWTASTNGITARFAVMYDNTDANKTVIAHCLLDSAPADVSVTNGNTLTIGIANVFTLAMSEGLFEFAMGKTTLAPAKAG